MPWKSHGILRFCENISEILQKLQIFTKYEKKNEN